ncbi:MAG: hypothetical protein ACTSXP_11780 [Promethearchaeota archaeon]
MKTKNKNVEQALLWKAFARKRRVLSTTTATIFLSNFGTILYILSLGERVQGDITSWDIYILLIPAIAGLLAMVVLSTVQLYLSFRWRFSIKGKVARYSKVFLLVIVCLSTSVLILFIRDIMANAPDFIELVHFTHFQDMSTIMLIIILALVGINMYFTVELSDKKLARYITPPYIEEKMSTRNFFKRWIRYCGKHYWQLFLILIGFQLIIEFTILLIFSHWGSQLLREHIFLRDWLTNHDTSQDGTTELDPEIQNRIIATFWGHTLYFLVQDIFKETGVYFSLAIGTRLVIKSYRGSDALISVQFHQSKRRLPILVSWSIVFSILFNISKAILLIPGLIVYIFLIFTLPELGIGKNQRFRDVFKNVRQMLKGQVLRTTILILIMFLVSFLLNFAMEKLIYDPLRVRLGGTETISLWVLESMKHFGQLFFIEFIHQMFMMFVVPLEISFVAILYLDLRARKRVRELRKKLEEKKPPRIEKAKEVFITKGKIKKAKYCLNCGLSVQQGLSRCPNCNAKLK